MKKIQRNKNPDRKKVLKKILLSVAILGCMVVRSVAAYGFDTFGSFDTGGFDMDIGEGSGELPSDWDATETGQEPEPSENEPEVDNRLEPESGDWTSQTENISPEGNATWEPAQDVEKDHGYEENSGGDESNKNIVENVPGDMGTAEENSGSESPGESLEQNPTVNQENDSGGNSEITAVAAETPSLKPEVTSTPVPEISFTPTPTPRPVKTVTATPKISPKVKEDKKEKQKLALSYYQTEEKKASPSGNEKNKEKCPFFHAEIKDNKIYIRIQQDDPVQLLSLRIGKKECSWQWQGKMILAELPEKAATPQKVEILIYVRSGKLYYKILKL